MSRRRRRKRRQGEVVCTCGAYRFPHRQMGGRCDGGTFVSRHFDQHLWSCRRDCMLAVWQEETGEMRCQVLDGLERKYTSCPALQEHIQFNEIKIYGVNK